MKKALALLRGADPLDYGRRFARLRWRRAIPADEVREVSLEEPAREAFAGSDVWLLVRDETALPWPGSRFPVPEPGRVLLATPATPVRAAAHTLRELEEVAAGDGLGTPDSCGRQHRPAALSFRPGDFAVASGETVACLVERLLGSTLQQVDPDFRVLCLEDASERERPELTRHIPEGARRMLDAGCGAGGSSGALRSRRDALHVTGIEKDPASARAARARLDRVIADDATRALAGLAGEGENFDAFLFADVLEHLADPVETLARARHVAVPGATLIASVPNAGHLSIVRDLVMGRFDPVPAGLTDAGHLRWFTKASLAEALEEAGWDPVSIESWPGAAPLEPGEFLSDLKDWRELDRASLMTYQWIAVARAHSGRTRRPDLSGPEERADEAEEDLLLCSLDSPVYQEIRFGAVNRFRGMVLDCRGPIVRNLRVSIDGKAAGEYPANLPSEELSRNLPNLPAARNCRFEFELFLPVDAGTLDFEAVREGARTAPLLRYDVAEVRASSQKLEAMRRGLAALPAPGPDIVLLTQGHGDVTAYRDSIIPGVVNAKKYLGAAGVDPERLATVLDFGCGSGRSLIGWHLDNPARSLFGCDTNARLIDWAREHLPASIHLDRSSPLPPLPHPSDSFDLVCAISVFTHLRFDTQTSWARELARILRPGGVLLLTLHGRPYVRLFLPGRIEDFERAGHLEIESAVDGANESASFHEGWIVGKLFREFEVLGRFPVGRIEGRRVLFPLAAFQDVYVLRRAG